jgi:hypothetical protein
MPITSIPYPVVTPLSFSNCSLWLDASDSASFTLSGSSITTWRDKSGNGRHAVGNTGTGTYSSNGFAGYPTVQIAVNQTMKAPVPAGTFPTAVTGYVVWQKTGSSTGADALISRCTTFKPAPFDMYTNSTQACKIIGSGTSWSTYSADMINNLQNTSPNIYYFNIAASANKVWNESSNGNFRSVTTADVYAAYGDNASFIHIGTREYGDTSMIGNISEIIMYSATPSDTQRQQIEGYLAQKWGITPSLAAGHAGITQKLFAGAVTRTPLLLTPYTVSSPAGIPGCQLWLDASDTSTMTFSGSNVTAWNDKSGSSNHMNQAVASWVGGGSEYPYTGTAINGRSTLYFSPSAGLKQSTILDGVKHLFWIGRHDSSGFGYCYFLLGNDGFLYDWHPDYQVYGTTYTSGAMQPGIQAAGPASQITSDSNAVYNVPFSNVSFPSPQTVALLSVSGITGTSRYKGICYDRSPGNHCGWCGDLAEVLVYNTVLSTAQVQQIEGYLSWKWGLQTYLPNTHPFYTKAPTNNRSALLAPVTTKLSAASVSYAAYYTGGLSYSNISQANWNNSWQPYLKQLAAANSGAIASFSSNVVTGTLAGYGKYQGSVLAPNGKIYFIPNNSTSVGVIDPVANTYTQPISAAGGYWGGVLAPNGKIYCVPQGGSTAIGIIDPNSNTFTAPISRSDGNSFSGGVLAPNGKIYCMPSGASNVGVINTNSNTFSILSASFTGATSNGGYYYGGVLAPNGLIYCIPSGASNIGIIDPVANTFTTASWGVMTGASAGNNMYYGGVLAPNGKIYCIPYGAQNVGVIDPDANTFTTFGQGQTGGLYTGGALGPDGKIYCVPYQGAKAAVIDPVLNTITPFGTPFGGLAYWGATMAANGTIYCAPFLAEAVGTITLSGIKQLPSSNYFLSAFTNKL